MKFFLLSLLLALQISCSSAFKIEFPKEEGLALSAQKQEEYLTTLAQNYNHAENIRALARVTITRGTESQTLRYVVVVDKKSNRLRIEILAPSSALTLQVLVVKDSQATILSLQDEKAYLGEFSEGLLEKFIGVRADINDLFTILTGLIGEDAFTFNTSTFKALVQQDAEAHFYSDNDRLFFSVKENELSSLMKKDPFQDRVELYARYFGKLKSDNMVFPQRVEILLPKDEVKAELRYRIVKANSILKDSLFELVVPSHYRKRVLP